MGGKTGLRRLTVHRQMNREKKEAVLLKGFQGQSSVKFPHLGVA